MRLQFCYLQDRCVSKLSLSVFEAKKFSLCIGMPVFMRLALSLLIFAELGNHFVLYPRHYILIWDLYEQKSLVEAMFTYDISFSVT